MQYDLKHHLSHVSRNFIQRQIRRQDSNSCLRFPTSAMLRMFLAAREREDEKYLTATLISLSDVARLFRGNATRRRRNDRSQGSQSVNREEKEEGKNLLKIYTT